MYREFISPAEEKKLEIFKVVCNSNGVTLVQLSEVLNIPQKSLQKYIYFLNEDLQLLSPHLLLSKNHYNQYFVDRAEDDEPFYAKLMYHYLLNSTQYTLIHYLIGRPQMTLTQLCLDLHVSQSHMYRLIKKINQLLDKFQIQIRTDLNNRIVLAGKELDIRIFTYSFLTQSAPADLWLLPSVSHKNVEEFTAFFAVSHFDPLTKNKLAAFWQAVVSRTIQKKYLPAIPEKYMGLMNFYCFLPEEILESLFLSADYASEKTLQSEYLYLNFFLHVFLPGVIPQAKNQAIIQEIKHSDTDLVRFFTAMIKNWHDTFAPSQEVAEFEKLLSSCLLVFNLSIIIGIDLLEVWQLEHQLLTENTPSKDKTYEAICNLLLTHVERYPFADLDKEYFEQTQLPYLAHLLYLETQMNTPPTVSIYIQTTIQYRTKQMIETRIRSIYSKASVTFVNQMEAADLLITDSYEEVIFSEKLVLLSNLQAEQEWAAVFAKINQLMMTKMFAKQGK